ncbi:HD domain-containing protein [Thermoleophilia bacterium SCSIO 60948]|nr:HD domain-containing protein [Thermoleophilia bacterium SCSIO 60948]
MADDGPDPRLGDRFADALALTSELHRGQARKTARGEGPGVSYLGHLLGVTSIVIDAGGSEDQAIAALLHDAAEDQGGESVLKRIEERFGPTVEGIVRDCSDWLGDGEKPAWLERKKRYLEHLEDPDAVGEDSLLVSLADKLYNARAIELDRRRDGEAVWDRFNADRDSVLWYYRSLADVFARRRPGPLTDELALVVDALEAEPAATS